MYSSNNPWVTISQENVKTIEKDVEFHKKLLEIHGNNRICVTSVIPCISVKNSKNTIPLNVQKCNKYL